MFRASTLLIVIPALMAIGVILAPVLLQAQRLDTCYLGSPTPDFYDHVFLFDWFGQVLRGEASPWHTTRVKAPEGGAIAMPDPFGAVLYAVAQPLLGPVLGWNLALLAALAAGAAAAVWLAALAGVAPAARIVVGVAYAGSAYAYGQLGNGETETLHLDSVALVMGALLLVWRGVRWGMLSWRLALFAGLTVGVAFAASWYYGAYALVLSAGLSVMVVTRVVRGGLRGGLRLLGGVALAAALVAPQAVGLSAALYAPDSLFRLPDVMTVWRSDLLALGASSTDLANLVAPGGLSSHTGYSHGGYVGALMLTLVAAAAVTEPWARGWAVLGLMFLLLSLGPILFIGGQPAYLGEGPVLLPYGVLAEVVPWFQSMRLPYRCMVVAHLCLAVAAGLGLPRLLPGRLLFPSSVALSCLLVVDVATFSGLPTLAPTTCLPASPPAAARATRDTVVLDLPVRLGAQDLRGYYLAMRAHTREKLPYSLMSTQVGEVFSLCPLIPALAALDPYFAEEQRGGHVTAAQAFLAVTQARQLTTAPFSDADRLRSVEVLRSRGVGLVVLHRGLVPEEAELAMKNLLDEALGAPQHVDDEVAVYAVP